MLGMALVPETRALFATMSVEDNLLLGAYRQVRLGNKDSAKSLNEVFMLFPRLRERRTQPASRLSGGERQGVTADEQVLERLEPVHRVTAGDARDALVGVDAHERRIEPGPGIRVPGRVEGG